MLGARNKCHGYLVMKFKLPVPFDASRDKG